jgi:hypothetical protein
MWKIIWASYLAWYAYTVITQDYTMDRSNSLNLAYYGGSLAFLVCVNYGISFRDWFGQIKEDKESLRNLESEVRDLQHELFEMKLRLGWVVMESDD